LIEASEVLAPEIQSIAELDVSHCYWHRNYLRNQHICCWVSLFSRTSPWRPVFARIKKQYFFELDCLTPKSITFPQAAQWHRYIQEQCGKLLDSRSQSIYDPLHD